MLVELALQGRVETDGATGLNGPRVSATGDGPLADPLLQSVYDKIAQRVQPLLLTIGGGLRKPVIERLLGRGITRQEKNAYSACSP